MWLEIDYKTAKKRYPKEVAEIMKKVKAGKSKHRNSAPELWAWGFSWSVMIGGMIGGHDFAQMIAGVKEFPKKKELTPDEEVKDYAGRATVHLGAKIGKAQWGSPDPIEFPNEIAESVREGRKRQDTEKARFDALSPEEQNREINDTLRQLSRSPGFVAIGMGGPESPMPKALVAQGPEGPEDLLVKPLDGDTGDILAKINNAIKKR